MAGESGPEQDEERYPTTQRVKRLTVRTGDEYVSGLRAGGREVWLGAERVHDVTGHPVFAGSVRGMAGSSDISRLLQCAVQGAIP